MICLLVVVVVVYALVLCHKHSSSLFTHLKLLDPLADRWSLDECKHNKSACQQTHRVYRKVIFGYCRHHTINSLGFKTIPDHTFLYISLLFHLTNSAYVGKKGATYRLNLVPVWIRMYWVKWQALSGSPLAHLFDGWLYETISVVSITEAQPHREEKGMWPFQPALCRRLLPHAG